MQDHWHRFDIRQIEDLANAVFGAELEVTQMAGARIHGSLAFSARNGVMFSSGWIQGNVAVTGPFSHDAVTIGVGLRVGTGSRLWLNTIRSGDVGVFLPGEQQDGFYTKGTLYLAATLTAERLREQAARECLDFDMKMVSRSGLHDKPISPRVVARWRSQLAGIHASGIAGNERAGDVGFEMLRHVIAHYLQFPSAGDGRISPVGRARTVERARGYIRANLARPIAMETLAAASDTSQRSLARAFVEVLRDTPASYVRRLRLHRIRRDLAAAEPGNSVSRISEKWGIREHGRMSGWYGELFGELPTETRARARLQNRMRRHLL